MKSILLFIAVVLKGSFEATIVFLPFILIGLVFAFILVSLGDLLLVVLLIGYGLYKTGLLKLNPLLKIWDTHKRQSFKNIIFYYRLKLKHPSLFLDDYEHSVEDVIISIDETGEYFISFVDINGLVPTKGKPMSLGAITKYSVNQLSSKPENKAIISVDTDVDFNSALSLMSFLRKNGVGSIVLHFKSI